MDSAQFAHNSLSGLPMGATALLGLGIAILGAVIGYWLARWVDGRRKGE